MPKHKQRYGKIYRCQIEFKHNFEVIWCYILHLTRYVIHLIARLGIVIIPFYAFQGKEVSNYNTSKLWTISFWKWVRVIILLQKGLLLNIISEDYFCCFYKMMSFQSKCIVSFLIMTEIIWISLCLFIPNTCLLVVCSTHVDHTWLTVKFFSMDTSFYP